MLNPQRKINLTIIQQINVDSMLYQPTVPAGLVQLAFPHMTNAATALFSCRILAFLILVQVLLLFSVTLQVGLHTSSYRVTTLAHNIPEVV